jgi:hypothetical protein
MHYLGQLAFLPAFYQGKHFYCFYPCHCFFPKLQWLLFFFKATSPNGQSTSAKLIIAWLDNKGGYRPQSLPQW